MKFLKPKFWDKNEVSFFSIILFPIALLIKFLSFLKRSFTKTQKCSIPIICVGNIYLGGTGKTPLCIEIYSILKKLDFKPAFIRKKYESFDDEVDLQKKFGPVYQNKKRIEAIKNAIKHKTDIAILDDGFQDFSLKNNLSIVCFNEKQWIGNGFTIPCGPLRESFSSIKRADCIVINGEKNTDIENKIFDQNKKIKIYYTKYKAQNIHNFENKRAIAFAGIGNPENFFDLLKGHKINTIEKISYPDHYDYSNKELENLINRSKNNNAILLTTEKDYLRINKEYRNHFDYIKIKVEMKNKNEFIEEIKKII